ncbi:hypothetical protein J7E70_27175, partial [Variovorax paradoxus]
RRPVGETRRGVAGRSSGYARQPPSHAILLILIDALFSSRLTRRIAARPRFYRQRFTFDQQLSDIDFRHWGKK